jgi:BirA family biotin operon repressor/biotin-[acetyl-CoA-carboxylase] ligase
MSGYISNKIIKFQSVDSTNNYATRLIMSSSPEEWTIISAEEQLSGKGQKGNKWESEKGKKHIIKHYNFPNFLEVYDQFSIIKSNIHLVFAMLFLCSLDQFL